MNRKAVLLSKLRATFDERPVEPMDDEYELPIPIMLTLAAVVSLVIWYVVWTLL